MAWLRKHPVIEDIGVGALGVGATLATGGLADLATGAVGTMAEGLGDAAGAAAEGDSSWFAKGTLGSLKKSAAVPGSRHGCNRHHDRGRPIRVYRRSKGRRRTDAVWG